MSLQETLKRFIIVLRAGINNGYQKTWVSSSRDGASAVTCSGALAFIVFLTRMKSVKEHS